MIVAVGLLVPAALAGSSLEVRIDAARPPLGLANFGTRLTLTPCTDPLDLNLPGNVTTDQTACNTITASGTVAGDVTLTAGKRIGFETGFQVAAGSTMTAAVDPAVTGNAIIEDRSPQAERRYVARYYLDSTDMVVPTGERFEQLVATDAAGLAQFRVVLIHNDSMNEDRVVVEVRLDDGTFATTADGLELELPTQWNAIEVDWLAATSGGVTDGTITVCVNDDGGRAMCSAIPHDHAGQVDRVRWGAQELDQNVSGSVDLDDFLSQTTGPIGL